MPVEITKVGVVGMGTMGAGIAQLCMLAGVDTIGRDVTAEAGERGRASVAGFLDRSVEKGQLEGSAREEALGRLTVTTEMGDLDGCDLVIEAAFEDLGVKRELVAALDEVLGEEAFLASNTSALSLTEIAAASSRPERIVGMHFFNPAPLMPLVEIVRGERTRDDVFEAAFAFARRLGKVPVRCHDTPGFVVNRILIPLLNDAVQVLEEGTASPEDIDKGMKLGTGWPIGPLALIDLIGIDVHVHVCEALWNAYREPKFAPPPRLVRMTKAGLLGRKSGEGFYRYDR